MEQQRAYTGLTRHPRGSLRELLHLALPLMLSVLSGNLMQFADRLVLARYATLAMNGAVIGGMFAAFFQYGIIGIVAIAEIFVGRFNGAGELDRVGRPVWQMAWFSLLAAVLFVPVAIFLGPIFVGAEYASYGVPYFRILLYFAPIFALVTAFSAFFIGLGKVRLVTIVTIVANIINIALNIPLVFGVGSWLPALGTAGAALATGISQVVQLLCLLIFFFNRSHLRYGTRDWRLRPGLLWDCLRIGVPSAVGHMIEIGAWAGIMRLISAVSVQHMTIASIGGSFFTLFAFMTEGLQKAVTTIAANFIGAGELGLIPKLVRSSVQLVLLLALVLAIPLLIVPGPIIDLFLIGDGLDVEAMHTYARVACFGVWAYFLADGVTWLFAGVITAGGDTKFVMVMNGVTAWFFVVLPTYVVIYLLRASPGWIWPLVAIYGVLNCICFYLRYTSGRWRALSLTTS